MEKELTKEIPENLRCQIEERKNLAKFAGLLKGVLTTGSVLQ